MDNTGYATTENPDNSNKILLFIFLSVLAVTITLVSFYLYKRYGGLGNKNDVSLIHKSAPFVYNIELPSATVGEQYKTVVAAGVYNLNVQINGRVESGLPPGLRLTSCSTDYNSPKISKIASKNSFGQCAIEGVPQQSGNFMVMVYFSIPGGDAEFYKVFPLTVNP